MKKLFLLSAALMAVSAMSAQDFDVYVIGSNVNGDSWKLSAEGAKMTFVSEGVYEWDGQVLGAGFKFNDGTWNNDEHNWGVGQADPIELGVPYVISAGGGTANIAFEGFKEVKNPHIVLNLNDMMVTLTGEESGKIEWYLVGDFNDYNGPATKTYEDEATAPAHEIYKFTEVGANQYELESIEFTDETTMKVSNTGWGKQYGDNDGTIMWGINTVNEDGSNSAVLQEVGSEGAMPVYMIGTYKATWDLANFILTFVEDGSGVKTFEAVNGAAEYFNLQGVKVNGPANGLFIKVVNGKATKVAIR